MEPSFQILVFVLFTVRKVLFWTAPKTKERKVNGGNKDLPWWRPPTHLVSFLPFYSSSLLSLRKVDFTDTEKRVNTDLYNNQWETRKIYESIDVLMTKYRTSVWQLFIHLGFRSKKSADVPDSGTWRVSLMTTVICRL